MQLILFYNIVYVYVRKMRKNLAAAGGRFHGEVRKSKITCIVHADRVDLATSFC